MTKKPVIILLAVALVAAIACAVVFGSQKADLSSANAAITEQLTAEQEKTAALEKQVADLTAAVAEKDETITGLEAAVTEKDEAITGLEAAVTEKDEAIAGLEGDVTAKTDEITALTEQVGGMVHAADLEAAKAEAEKQTGLVAEKDVEIKGLQDEIAKVTGELTAAQDSLAAAQESLTAAQDSLTAAEKERDQAVMNNRAYEIYIRRLKDAAAAKDAKIVELESALEGAAVPAEEGAPAEEPAQ